MTWQSVISEKVLLKEVGVEKEHGAFVTTCLTTWLSVQPEGSRLLFTKCRNCYVLLVFCGGVCCFDGEIYLQHIQRG